jgi:lipopolysaccharide/colanic/teichoic acid biosynthesis glycosyltransferase
MYTRQHETAAPVRTVAPGGATLTVGAEVSGGNINPGYQAGPVEIADLKITTAAYSPAASRVAYYSIKRLCDILISLSFLLLLSPLFLVIAILIVLDSPGPVFFRQTRVGVKRVFKGGGTSWVPVRFSCLKFRTMTHNADQSLHRAYVTALIKNDSQEMSKCQGMDTQVKKLVHDPRITSVGRILRKWSLDELPQFWNVVMNDMSLVGPRPAIPYEVEEYLPWHHNRLNAQPGLTGLWQVTARSSCDFDEMVHLDMLYIQKQSVWLDLKIMLKTPWVIITSRGAQ